MKKLTSILTVTAMLATIFVYSITIPTSDNSNDGSNEVFQTMNNRVLPGG